MAPALIQEVEDEPASSPNAVELTSVESTLKRLLLDVAKYIDEDSTSETLDKLPTDSAKEPVTLRFTGGWVRDKLLGVGSHDIDVAINKMTGYQFGLRLKGYLEIRGNPEKYGLEGVATSDKQSQKAGTTNKSRIVGGLHKIEANPEKSKHLETVTTRIFGLDIDLVNLRKEIYTDETRFPEMEMGTPQEDAFRRDATVNAMFYNLNTGEIEDFTGKGHDDMKAKIIRTPLEPFQTFKDDPLRVLRLIRFASRLDYQIEPKAQTAMRDAEIQDALKRKISRERVGVELGKALRGPDPHEAMRLIFALDLYETVFSDPTLDPSDHYNPETENWQKLIDFTRDLLDDGEDMATILLRGDEDRFLAWQLAALVPYRDAPHPEPSQSGRKAPPPIAVSVAREGVKSENAVSNVVAAAVRNQTEISDLVDKFHQQKRRPDKKLEGVDATARDVLGLAVRRWGARWRNQAVYSLLVDVANDPESSESTRRKYSTFIAHLQKLDILNAYDFKPLIDGKTLSNALNTKTGPWMKEALDVVMAWQLRNPDSISADDAIAEVREHRQPQNGGELTSSLVQHFLSLTIRPLFIKAQPSSVTDAGRKNTTTMLPKKITVESMDDSINKPCKSAKDAHALDLLKWCVNALDEQLVEKAWPQIVPPGLTLIDDQEPRYKTLGAELLTAVLKTTPITLLQRTGLGQVFEEALVPCLAYIPPVTSEAECIPLLNATYAALLQLASMLPAQAPAKSTLANRTPPRTKLLDKVIHKGILPTHSHAQTSPAILTNTCTHLTSTLTALGINSVKHLKYTIPLLQSTLTHPLGNAHPGMLLSATKALQAVILNGWPRMEVHRAEVLKGVTFCWLGLNIDGEKEEHVRVELKETVKLLRAAVETGDVDWEGDCSVLIGAEPRLEGLLR